MTTEQLILTFTNNHRAAANFIHSLPDEQFISFHNDKWSPGQQLLHLILCIKPISQALSAPAYIKEKFGLVDHPPRSYDEIMELYRTGLQNGGKAPERFVPAAIDVAQREGLMQEMNGVLATIQTQLSNYSETDLDTLALPHPFLGLLSIRELFYLMSYHPLHHLEQVKKNLSGLN